MSPILGARGGLAASAYGFISGVAGPGDYQSISTVTVGSGGAASVSFTSIPSTYTHLQIRSMAVNTAGASGNYATMQFNSDTGNNYAWHLITGDGSAAYVNSSTSTNSIRYDQGLFGTNSNTAPQITVCDILDYGNTSKNKTTRALDGGDANGAGFIELVSGVWLNTNAISSINIYSFSGASASTFGQYSSFALYGVK